MNPQALRTIRFVWFALMASTLVYFYIGWAQLRTSVPVPGFERPPSLENPMFLYLLVLSIALVPMAIWLPRGMIGAVLKKLGRSANLEQHSAVLLPALIIRGALLEAIALNGFVMSMISSDLKAQWILGGLSIACFLALMPTNERMTAMFEAAKPV